MGVIKLRNTTNDKSFNRIFNRWFGYREKILLIIIVSLITIMTIISPEFCTLHNFNSLGVGVVTDSIVVIGITIALIGKVFDFSVGGILTLSAAIAVKLYLLGYSIWISIFIALICALFFGLINGVFIGGLGVNSIVMTIGMMEVTKGITKLTIEGEYLSLTNNISPTFSSIGKGAILGIPISVLILILMVIISQVLLKNTTSFKKIIYTGSNERAARLMGINISIVKIRICIMSAFFAGLAGIVSIAQLGGTFPTLGDGVEMTCISAAIIGGASLEGGEGTILGSVLAILLLDLINNALVIAGISSSWQRLIGGMILIAVITITHKSKKNSKAEL